MQMKLELVPLAVADVDRALQFYEGRLGFTKDVDVRPGDGIRVVQLTPEGSGCSIGFGTGLDVYGGVPGSARGLHLVVEDVAAARVLADMATIYLVNVSKLDQQRQLNTQLQHALNSRVIIEQAKGIIATAHGTTVDTAFELIRRHARNHNARIQTVAEAIVHAGLRV